MNDLKSEVLTGVLGSRLPFDGDKGTVVVGEVGGDGLKPIIAVWVEGPLPIRKTYMSCGRTKYTGREIIESAELLNELKAVCDEVTFANLQATRLALIEHNAPERKDGPEKT